MTATRLKRRHSLSGKLVLLFIVMAVVFVMLVGGGIRHAFQEHFRDNIRPHITQYLEYVKADIGTPPDHRRAQQLADRLNIEIQIIDARTHWSSSGRITRMDAIDIERGFFINGKQYFYAEDNRTHYLMTRDNGATLLFNVPNLRDQRKGFRGWIPLLILLALLLVLYHATRRLFGPLDTIKQGVQQFGAGDLDHRIHVKRKDELGELASSFNAMADDIRQMLDAKRQLLLAISHELRSPLTRSRVAAEMLEDGANKAQIVQDISEMETLIEGLMETERLSGRHRKLNKESHDIGKLLHDVLGSFFEGADLSTTVPQTAVLLDVDAARIKLLLKNLLDNAIRHSPEDAAPPEIQLATNEHEAVITVTDHGEGIDAQHLPHLAEPFYRVDPSRQRETGGYGLGLYLCRMIAEAHGGRLQIDSTRGEGTTVSVTLPL